MGMTKEEVKIYKAEHYLLNEKRINEKNKRWKLENPEQRAKVDREWVENNRDKVRATKQKYKKANPEKTLEYKARRRAAKTSGTPGWLSLDQINEMRQYYRLAKSREMFEGQKFHVDHIVPLLGESVRGLHVPWNLRVIPAEDNHKKGNRYDN